VKIPDQKLIFNPSLEAEKSSNGYRTRRKNPRNGHKLIVSKNKQAGCNKQEKEGRSLDKENRKQKRR
jgi:hypothetical protein